jgi:uncharacterized membrane protein
MQSSTMSVLPESEMAAKPVFLDAVLRPHRSLPWRGFLVLMGAFGGVSFAIGLIFVLHGAWPVTGFFGADVGLFYLAFRLSYRSARQFEHVILAEDVLTVERVNIYGGVRRWCFEPFWLRVVFEEEDDDTNRLMVTSHGRSLVLGSFLSPRERKDFATALKQALGRWRASLTSG